MLASNAGFQEVEIMENYRWRQGKGWAMRATRTDRVQHLDLTVNGKTVLASCCFGKADRKPATAIPDERRTVCHAERASNAKPAGGTGFGGRPAGFVGQKTPTEQGKGSNNGTEETMETGGGSPGEAGKRPAAGTPQSGASKKSKTEVVPAGLTVIANQGEGNCLFHALSDAFGQVGSAKGHGILRAMAVSHLRRYGEAYVASWDKTSPDQKGEKMADADFDKYLDLMAREGSWGSALEITALANTTDHPIWVFDATDPKTFVFNRSGKKKPLMLRYTQNHFEALVGQVRSQQEWRNIIEGPRTGLKGGGPGSITSMHTSSSKRRALLGGDGASKGTASSVKRRLRAEGRAAACHSRAGVSDRARGFSGSEGHGQSASEDAQQGRSSCSTRVRGSTCCGGDSPGVKRKRPAEADAFTWVCDECKVPLSARTEASLGSKRNNHITREHPTVPRTRFHQVRVRVEPHVALDTNRIQVGGWMCSRCSKVLAPMPGQHSTRQASIRMHLRQCFPNQVITPAENARRVLRNLGGPTLPRDAHVPPKLLGAAFEVHRVIGELQGTSPHDLKAVGSQAEGMHITCAKCCFVWKRASTCRYYHAGSYYNAGGKVSCNPAARPAVLSRHAKWWVSASRELQRVLLAQWQLSNALQNHLKVKARADQSLEGISAASGHDLIKVLGERMESNRKGYRKCFTCKKCAVQWRTVRETCARAARYPCTAGQRAKSLTDKRRYWPKIPHKLRLKLARVWALSRSEKRSLAAVPARPC